MKKVPHPHPQSQGHIMPKRNEKGGTSSSLANTKRKRIGASSDSGCSSSSHQEVDKDKEHVVLSLMDESEDEELFGCGSRKQLNDLFNHKKNGCSQLSKDDLLKAEEDIQKFLNKGSSTNEKTNNDKDKGLGSTSNTNGKLHGGAKPKEKERLNMSFDTSELLREADELLADKKPSSSHSTPSSSSSSPELVQSKINPGTSSTSRLHRRSSNLRSRKKKDNETATSSRNPSILADEIVISDSDEEVPDKRKFRNLKNNRSSKKNKGKSSSPIIVHEISDDESEIDLGHLLLFHAELKSEKFPMRMYEKQYVRELRAMVAEKAKSPVETLQMFLGDYIQLEDDKTLDESGITNLCTVETYLIHKSEKDLYEQGSTSVLKFKLQTEDRRGRLDAFVFVSRTGKMQSAIEQYAKDLGISCAGMKLHFDGEEINLNSTPEECDLEGGECLDLQV